MFFVSRTTFILRVNLSVCGFPVVKMNVDTDTQWAYWEGVMAFYKKNTAFMQGQIGNPKGKDVPNKKYEIICCEYYSTILYFVRILSVVF